MFVFFLDLGTSTFFHSPQFGLDYLSLTPLTPSFCLTTWSLTLNSHFNTLTAAGDTTDGPRSQILNTTLLEDRCYICAAVETEMQTNWFCQEVTSHQGISNQSLRWHLQVKSNRSRWEIKPYAGCVRPLHPCLSTPGLSSRQLGSQELLLCVFVETAKGLGSSPMKTHTLWPSFLIATSQSSLFRHTRLSPLLSVFNFNIIAILPFIFHALSCTTLLFIQDSKQKD